MLVLFARRQEGRYASGKLLGPLQGNVVYGVRHPYDLNARTTNHQLLSKRDASAFVRKELGETRIWIRGLGKREHGWTLNSGVDVLGILIPHRAQDFHVIHAHESRANGVI